MSASLPIGLIMIGVGVFMFVIAMPRRGELVGFLRASESLEAMYTMLLMFLMVVGGVLTLSNL